MPSYWHDKRSINNKFDVGNERDYQRSIVADKKPYFMRYIYPDLMKKYNTYIKNTNRNAMMEFDKTVDELRHSEPKDLTAEESEFLKYYNHRMPVGVSDCVMNRICRKFEAKFDRCISRYHECDSFDYTIMKSDDDYSRAQMDSIKKMYDDYNKRIRNLAIYANCERVDDCEYKSRVDLLTEHFRRECESVCQNSKVLCNILLDMCYTRSATKRFVWSICGETIVNNLIEKNGFMLSYPSPDPNGDIEFCGRRFALSSVVLEEQSGYCTE